MKNLLFLLAALVMFSSCKKDEVEGMSSEDAQIAMENMASDMNADIIDLMQSDGVESLSSLFDFASASSQFGDIGFRKDDIKFRAVRMAKVFAHGPNARVGTESSDFTTGVYAWNVEEQDFIFVESAEVLKLWFPAPGSETNNAVFTLSELSFDSNELPTAIDATIHVDENLIVSLDLEANWSSEGMPESATIMLYLKPFTFYLNFDDTAETQSYLLMRISNDDVVIASVELTVKYNSPDKEFPKHIAGTVTYREVTVKGEVDIQAALNSQSGNPNDFVSIRVFVDGSKIGSVVFIEEEYEDDGYTGYEYVPYLKYNDGTKVSLEELFGELFDDLDDELAAI